MSNESNISVKESVLYFLSKFSLNIHQLVCEFGSGNNILLHISISLLQRSTIPDIV